MQPYIGASKKEKNEPRQKEKLRESKPEVKYGKS